MLEVLEDMKPCPACGSTTVEISDMYRLAYGDYLNEEKIKKLISKFCIRCASPAGGCQSMSPSFDTKEEAIDYWKEDIILQSVTIGGRENGN